MLDKPFTRVNEQLNLENLVSSVVPRNNNQHVRQDSLLPDRHLGPLHVAMQIRLSHHPLSRGRALRAAWP